MAKETLINRKRFNGTLKNELYDKFDNLSKETMIPKTRLMDKAVELILKKYGKEVE